MSGARCYFPNGDVASDGEIPCGSGDGVACCPLNWECQTNGLCYLANQEYYGRYACTDQSWQSSGCPQICTHGNTAIGAEAILDCDEGSYCCDANRPDAEGDESLGCCSTTTDRFGINNGVMVNGTSNGDSDSDSDTSSSSSSVVTSTASSASPSASSASPSASSASPSASSASSASSSDLPFTLSSSFSDPAASVSTSLASISSTSSASSTDITSSEPTTTASVDQNNDNTPQSSTSIILVTSVVTQSNGISSTVTTSQPSIVAAPASTASPTNTSAPAPSSSKASVIAPAVAVPLAVIAFAIMGFFLWRRRKQRKAAAGWENDSPGYDRRSEPVDMYASQKPEFPELESPEMKQSPSSYESPDQVGKDGAALGLGVGTMPPSYRGTGAGGQNPGDATRLGGQSVSPVSPASPPKNPPLGSFGGNGSGAGGLHVVNPTAEPSELPGSTYHAYRPPGAGASGRS